MDRMTACFRRYLTLAARNRRDFALSFVQPLVYIVLFGPLFVASVNMAQHLTQGRSYALYVSGLCLQIAMTIGAFSGLSIILEYRLGILERIWSTPSLAAQRSGGESAATWCS
ncbi:hypothetical protein E5345_02370 [Propionibacterium sp. NM47_B9-13]|jgi:ABC-2 type transport system permease protein|uniref:ABC-2 type transporter transmembrane domain-containing protein n=2 Tax=Cutibacterium modestum TaxID=2559073 RepID=A0AAD1KRU2_9ACTN|nr:ABC transporter permease [Cutibacterium modestum]TGY30127.1 hypothetical protein E5345_02370 [Propionibacterium sp. NM47_B9-13]AOH45861.1 hypothetical protein BCB70_08045 [Cutibacterium modestum]EFS74044.1 hypothetical protein HMPREF9621_01582 [Cutibacterium modestum HL037PA2]EFS92625.1 hypothetical protein HMPREF9607_01155 [Cutibacterium modestum HL044PA1]EFT15268.1 hypothetical protein HMPREF9622_01634 [Cutibacterium modestum HL037PA3]